MVLLACLMRVCFVLALLRTSVTGWRVTCSVMARGRRASRMLRRELEMRGVSVEAAERADEVGESAGSVEGAAVADATADTDVSDTEGAADSL